jgi:hypothetical protein
MVSQAFLSCTYFACLVEVLFRQLFVDVVLFMSVTMILYVIIYKTVSFIGYVFVVRNFVRYSGLPKVLYKVYLPPHILQLTVSVSHFSDTCNVCRVDGFKRYSSVYRL